MIPKKKVNALLEKKCNLLLMGKNTRCHLQCTKERQRPKCIFPNQFWESDREVPKTLLFYLCSPSYIVCLIWGSGTLAVLHVQIRGCTVTLIVKNYYSKETVEQWVMYTLYKVTVKLMYTLYNDLTNFSKKIVKSA